MEEWLQAGIRHFRLEFVHETPAQLLTVAASFRDALAGAISFRQLGEALASAAPQGVTEGSLYVPPSHPELPILK